MRTFHASIQRWWPPFSVWLIAFAASGYFLPDIYTWSWHGWEPKQAILPLVQVIMFGMGTTLTRLDFARVRAMPRAVLLGVVCQFSIMPLVGWLAASLWGLSGEVAAGLILVGSCPGGVASNVVAYIVRANVPLSVTMTACSTLLAPLVTPWAMYWLAGRHVPIDATAMTWSILWMIMAPLIMGLLANRYLSRHTNRLQGVLPLVAMGSICAIVAITIALARDDLSSVGAALFAAAACHNAAGYALGYNVARLSGLSRRDCRTVALEVGLQNGGMATGLALNVLHSTSAALASAVFGPWSAITSSLLASRWRQRTEQLNGDECLP